MTTTPHILATGPLVQAWSNAAAITTNDDWSGVPSIVGYLGQDITTVTGADPQTLTADSSLPNDLDVIANQTNPNTLNAGGVAEFALPDPTIALQGSGTADAPNLVLYLDATGRRDVVVAFNARDIDGSTDNAIQPLAVQYRTDGGAWKNLPAGFIADASTQGSATQVTPVSVTLPAEANGAAGLQVRIITANAVGNDEWIGIDDIAVSSQSAAMSMPALSIADAQANEGQAGTTGLTFTVSLSAPAPAGGVTFDVATADGTAQAGSDYVATVLTGRTIAAGATSTTITVPVNGDVLAEANETFALRVTNVVGATVTDGEATGTIVNDDASGVINGVAVFNAAASLQGAQGATATTAPAATNALQLVRLGSYATTNDPATTLPANAEVVAYDRTTGTLYVQNTNENRIEIVGISAAGQMAKSGEILLSSLEQYGSVNSVAVFNGLVAVAYANLTGDQPGRVALFDRAGALLKSVAVGIGPDQIVFTGDGTKLLVANEGEQFSTTSNPVGSVSILDLSRGATAASVSATVGFDALNGSEATLRSKGLAITAGKTAAADIEPEYIALSSDNRFAYVTLQEVNGVAVIDLANPGTAPIAIQPLGAVNHSLAGNEFDASDRDGANGGTAIRIATTPANAPIYGLLQPDGAASFAVNGVNYLVTANEGDQRVINGIDDSADVARLSSIANSRLTPELQALKADPAYARLNVLLRTGDTNNDGIIDQLNTLGGRGISIFRQEADNSLTKVRETGGEFEKIFAALSPERFNNDQVVANTPDDRSDNKGPEPEGVTIGTVNGRTYAFVGLEAVMNRWPVERPV